MFSPIIRILVSDMDCFRHHFPVGYTVTSQLICHNLPGFAPMTPDQPPEKALCGSPIASSLKEYIDYFTILIDGPLKVVLLTIDLHKDFVDVGGIAISLMLSLQAPRIFGPKLDAPEPDAFVADCDSSLG